MSNTRKRSLSFWLSWAIGLALVLAVSAMLTFRWLIQEDMQRAADRLQLLTELRKQALLDFFETANAETIFWAENVFFREAFQWSTAAWDEFEQEFGSPVPILFNQYVNNNPYPEDQRDHYYNADDGSEEADYHEELHTFTRRFVTERGYRDLYMVSTKGNVFYSVKKRDLYLANLKTGPYSDSGLGHVFRQSLSAQDSIDSFFSDLAPYGENTDSAMFVGHQVLGTDGSVQGALALELPIEGLEQIMQFDSGLNSAGEIILVGSDRKSRVSQTCLAVNFAEGLAGFMFDQAEAGKQGQVLKHPDDHDFLWVYDYVDVGSERWAVIGRIDKQQIITAQYQRNSGIAVAFVALYGLALSTLWLLRPEDWSAIDPELAMNDFDTPAGGDGLHNA